MKLRQNREIKKSIKIYRKEVFCGIVGILLISLIVFYTVLNSMENKRTLQVKNDVYSLGSIGVQGVQTRLKRNFRFESK